MCKQALFEARRLHLVIVVAGGDGLDWRQEHPAAPVLNGGLLALHHVVKQGDEDDQNGDGVRNYEER